MSTRDHLHWHPEPQKGGSAQEPSTQGLDVRDGSPCSHPTNARLHGATACSRELGVWAPHGPVRTPGWAAGRADGPRQPWAEWRGHESYCETASNHRVWGNIRHRVADRRPPQGGGCGGWPVEPSRNQCHPVRSMLPNAPRGCGVSLWLGDRAPTRSACFERNTPQGGQLPKVPGTALG